MKHTFKLFSGILGALILGSCQLFPTISSETSKGVDESIAESNVQTEVPSIAGPIETSEEGPVIDNGGPITVYLWSNTLYPQFAKHIQTKLADIDIQFVVGNNDLDFYRFMNDYGKLPDIITCRRFALRDAAPISSQLMDLSDTSAAGSIYDTYLTSFTNRDGSIQWLPMVGEVDGFVINKKLFRDNNIPIPTDYASFVDACDKFDKLGIRGFVGDYTYDYTCMGILQGLSIPSLTSLKGLRWRSQYEDPNAVRPGLDEEIWPKAFETMAKFLADTKAQASDVNMKYSTLANMFVQGKVAMVRAGAPTWWATPILALIQASSRNSSPILAKKENNGF